MAVVGEGVIRLAASEALGSDPNASAVAFTVDDWGGRDTLALTDGRNVGVVHSNSVLEIRERLVDASAEEQIVILTRLTEKDLGEDVVYRLAQRRVRRPGVWEPLMAAFGARSIDPRLSKSKQLADALQSNVPPGGYPKAPNGVLTEEHAWNQLISWSLGGSPNTPTELARLASGANASARLNRLTPDLLDNLVERLEGLLGPVAAPLVRCSASQHSGILVPLGAVTRIAYSGSDGRLFAARGLLAPLWGGMPSDEGGAAAAAAAEEVFRTGDESARVAWETKARELLSEAQLNEEAWRSAVLRQGLERRLERLAQNLNDATSPPDLLSGLDLVERHDLARLEERRVRAARMAVRLSLWLAQEDPDAGSLELAARLQVEDGGWVDLARDALRAKDPNETVNATYVGLCERVDQRRDTRSRTFAEHLAGALDAGTLGDCIGVEQAIPSRLAPLAGLTRLLVLVLDGLSEGAIRSISPSLEGAGWAEIGPSGAPRTPMIAVAPSLTRLSRASLLSGKLTTGGQQAERDGFDQAFADTGEPRLFHKADLGKNFDSIERELASDRRVVGVVVNAIDDLLDKGDLVNVDWDVDSIEPVRALIEAASNSQRVLAIIGDHGHVLHRGGELRSTDGGGARWRRPDPPAGAGEVLLRGPRVLEGNGEIVAPAIETLRYAKQAAGYHGGATPQEMVTPLIIFAPPGVEIDDWAPSAGPEPAWWALEATPEQGPVAEPAKVSRRAPTPQTQGQIEIFDTSPSAEPTVPQLISQLLDSALFQSRIAKAGRVPSQAQIAALLASLDRSAGVASEGTVARAIGVSAQRVAQVVASLRPVLNIEGFQVLTHDHSTGEVRLDRELLAKQFSL